MTYIMQTWGQEGKKYCLLSSLPFYKAKHCSDPFSRVSGNKCNIISGHISNHCSIQSLIHLNRCTMKVHLEEERKLLFSEDPELYLENQKGKLAELMRKKNRSTIRFQSGGLTEYLKHNLNK